MSATEVSLDKDFASGKGGFAFVDGACVEKPAMPEKMSAVCVYEVFRVHEGKSCYLDKHLERLKGSCEAVKFPLDNDALQKGVAELIEKCGIVNQNIKIIVAKKGDEPVHTYAYPVESFYPPLDYYTKGVTGKIIDYTRNDPTSKVLDMKLKDMMAEAKAQENVFELLLQNEKGEILEGTRSNLFCIYDGKVLTAPSDRVVPGVTRDRVLELCKKQNVPVVLTTLNQRTLKQSSSAFLSSTSNGIMPFSAIDSFHYDVAGDKILQNLMMDWFTSAQ